MDILRKGRQTMKNFLMTYVLCLFLLGFIVFVCSMFHFNIWVITFVVAAIVSFIASVWKEHDKRIETLEKRLEALENQGNPDKEKENDL